MVVNACKNCGGLNYLTSHAFWNITESAKCEKCKTINTIALEMGNLKAGLVIIFAYLAILPVL
jgi:phage FluMu protein Com